MTDAHEVTQALQRIRAGDSDAFETLLSLVYPELRELAHRYMARERNDHTLQATAVVHEAYLKLLAQSNPGFQDRAHFFAVSARALRQVLTDHARRRVSKKRGGGWTRRTLEDLATPESWSQEDLLTLDEALSRFAEVDPLNARIVEMRYFAGLSPHEIAEFLEVEYRSINRHLRYAETWLLREMTRQPESEADA